ncbi:MAG: hypothetical protein ACR2LQ_03455 [Acidimicrobiales bacterium]
MTSPTPTIRPYPTVTAFEHHDSERTHRFPTPALPDGALRVTTRTAPDRYPGPYNLVTRDPGELFVLFGVYAEVDGCDGAQVARLDADTLEQLWCTRLVDTKALERWNYMGVLGVLPDGDLIAIASDRIFRLAPDNGEIIAETALPVAGPVRDAAYNGYTMLSDGMIAAKTVHRHGTDVDGFAAFMAGNPFAAPGSTVTIVDPARWSVVTSLQAPEHIGGRITSTRLGDHDVIYLVGFNTLHRWRWDGTTLTVDSDWEPAEVRRDAQTPAPANAILGRYTVLQTNAVPSPDPMSVHCIDQSDSSHRHEVRPFADAGMAISFLPSMLSADPENQRLYTHDAAAGLLAGYDVADDGSLSLAWRVAQRSLSFTTLVGPDDQRVIIGTDIVGLDGPEGLLTAPTEQVVWRDAATGTERARSADLPRMSHGILVTPVFDGRFFELGHQGTVTELTVEAS